MSSISKHSKSVSNMIDKIDSNKKDTKNLIEKRYRMCYMSDDLNFEKNIESSSPSSVNAEKSRNLVTKLISRFEKKNDKNNDRTKNVNKEFLRRSFMRIPLPRVTTYYHDTCDNSSNLRESTLDENINRLSNIKNVQLNKNVKTFENDIEIVNDSDIIVKSSSSNFRLVDNDPKEKWTTSDKRWSETTNDEKINQKKSIKEVLSSLINWKKHNNKNKSRRSRSCDKSDKHHEILPSISIIPRAHSLQTVVINNTKDKNNTNLNRNATIRPIYGIKRNQTTPKKYLESFQSIKINPRKEDSGYGSGILSVEESIENLVKPSAIREMSKKLTFIPEQHQDQETWNHKDNRDHYRQVLSHCKRDRNSYQRRSFVDDELKEAVKKRFNGSSNESIIYTQPINHELKRNYSSLYINKISVNTEYENTQNISSPLQ